MDRFESPRRRSLGSRRTAKRIRSLYIMRMVCSDRTVDDMAGHHASEDDIDENIPLTLAITDESSSIKHAVFDRLKSWAKRDYSSSGIPTHASRTTSVTQSKGCPGT